jgi:hypothetical protein
LIGSPVGSAIGAAFPDNVATIFDQAVTANITASVSVTNSVGKIVTAGVDLAAALGNFTVGKLVTATVNATVSVTKAIAYTVAAALIDASGTVVKSVGKIVPAALLSVAVGAITKSVGKIVTATVTLGVSVSRAISITITAALMSLSAVIATLRRHPGKPLFFRGASGKRGYWRGSR